MEQPPKFDAEDLPTLCPQFHHVNLKTNQLQNMIDWYATVIGSKVTFQRHDLAFVTNDAANHRVAIVSDREYVEPEQRGDHIGMHHSAFEYDSLDELLQSWVRLDRESILPRFCLNHGCTMSFYYQDPDGNYVELQCDIWANSIQSGEFMHTDPRFLEDPIGRWVDPLKLIEARESGLTPWEVHVASYERKFEPDVPPVLNPVD
jgi:catechol 2,3-dioxygenase